MQQHRHWQFDDIPQLFSDTETIEDSDDLPYLDSSDSDGNIDSDWEDYDFDGVQDEDEMADLLLNWQIYDVRLTE